ncbi:hypothetical protein [Rosettibacter firmus]|uniref:hypothetical protein n=1 Tax=Rosettibacter firmus TaxID=3111522 RepID=UPI00336BF5E6
MSEMLGNYHFLIRDYSSAIDELENFLLVNPDDKRARKKLIICYTQVDELTKALNLFYSLVEQDIDFIINTDPEKEDCPCPDLVKKLEDNQSLYNNKYWFFIELGILWLYCDKQKSLKYFEEAYAIDSSDERVLSIIKKIKNTI